MLLLLQKLPAFWQIGYRTRDLKRLFDFHNFGNVLA
jgi:hypothetical protein